MTTSMFGLPRLVRASFGAAALALLALTGCGADAGDGPPGAASLPPSHAPFVANLPSVVLADPIAPMARFDDAAFRAAVDDAATTNQAHAAALPYAHVLAAAMTDAVRGIVALPIGLEASGVSEGPLACGGVDEADCAERFVHAVASFDGALATSLAPLARQVLPFARGARVSVWTSPRDGVAQPAAVTLHGLAGDRLVGIVVFR